MRVVRLCLLGLLAFIVTLVVLFPVSAVIKRIEPQLGPVALEGVSGNLFSGEVARVRSTDDLLPLEVRDVGWTLSPGALLAGGVGADVRYEGYGGSGSGEVLRKWNGDIAISDFSFTAEAKTLEPLLPVPVAAFSGALSGELASVMLESRLLTRLEGTLSWRDALLERPVRTSLGTVNLDVQQASDEEHVATIKANGGDVTVDGSVSFKMNGDFVANVLLTPSASAPPEVKNAVARLGQPGANGAVRVQQNGNINRLAGG